MNCLQFSILKLVSFHVYMLLVAQTIHCGPPVLLLQAVAFSADRGSAGFTSPASAGSSTG